MENTSRKKIRDEGSSKDKDLLENQRFHSERYFTYDIVRCILTYLNGKDLSKAAMVCRTWLEAANNIKKTRGYHYSKITTKVSNLTDLADAHKNLCKDIMVRPQLSLVFSLTSVVGSDCHCKNLQLDHNAVTIGCHGYILNTTEVERNVSSVVGVFIPEIPKVEIKTFIFKRGARRYFHTSVREYIDELIKFFHNTRLPENSSKAFMLLCDGSEDGYTSALALLRKLKHVDKFLPVWGGIVKDLKVCISKYGKRFCNKEHNSCVGIGIVGSGIKTWSIIVNKQCKTKEQIEERLKDFRNHVQLKKYSIGFMAACCARGENMFGETGVESVIFKKVFPEVLLVGFFGDGEFGENSVNTDPSRKCTKHYNTMSTTFMIITYSLAD